MLPQDPCSQSDVSKRHSNAVADSLNGTILSSACLGLRPSLKIFEQRCPSWGFGILLHFWDPKFTIRTAILGSSCGISLRYCWAELKSGRIFAVGVGALSIPVKPTGFPPRLLYFGCQSPVFSARQVDWLTGLVLRQVDKHGFELCYLEVTKGYRLCPFERDQWSIVIGGEENKDKPIGYLKLNRESLIASLTDQPMSCKYSRSYSQSGVVCTGVHSLP